MDDLTPAERRRADSDLDVAIKEASAAAPLLITLGVSLTSESSLCELDDILTRLHCILPSGTKQRLFISYAASCYTQGVLNIVAVKIPALHLMISQA